MISFQSQNIVIPKEELMEWDDEFEDEYEDMANNSHSSSVLDEGPTGGVDPLDIANPVSAYLFLSDDAQDEITGTEKKRMKCLSCGDRFMGDIYDRCPECFSYDTESIEN